MKYYDVFNGDADGICALHQLRLAEPREAELVSGVKRDNRLLSRLAGVRNAVITVLDISMETNREELDRLLESCRIFYADHHFAGELPHAAALEAHIDPNPETCTGLIIDRLLEGRYRGWAVVAAFGDNLHAAARRAAAMLDLGTEQLAALRELGELMNYNSYGRTVADLHFRPEVLYRAVQPFIDPLAFYHDSEAVGRLREGFRHDMTAARAIAPGVHAGAGRVYFFPAEAWARRVAGVFINERAREQPEQPHALLVANDDATYTVSVRAPLAGGSEGGVRQGADVLCRRFPTGGGRAAAAGINVLPAARVEEFLRQFETAFA
jgi:hypothetical protein